MLSKSRGQKRIGYHVADDFLIEISLNIFSVCREEKVDLKSKPKNNDIQIYAFYNSNPHPEEFVGGLRLCNREMTKIQPKDF